MNTIHRMLLPCTRTLLEARTMTLKRGEGEGSEIYDPDLRAGEMKTMITRASVRITSFRIRSPATLRNVRRLHGTIVVNYRGCASSFARGLKPGAGDGTCVMGIIFTPGRRFSCLSPRPSLLHPGLFPGFSRPFRERARAAVTKGNVRTTRAQGLPENLVNSSACRTWI